MGVSDFQALLGVAFHGSGGGPGADAPALVHHTGKGLVSRDGQPLSCFTIAGDDQKFVPATAVIQGDQVVVSATQVPRPVAVRFAWGAADEPNLANQEGLPATSFRTDDWPMRTQR